MDRIISYDDDDLVCLFAVQNLKGFQDNYVKTVISLYIKLISVEA